MIFCHPKCWFVLNKISFSPDKIWISFLSQQQTNWFLMKNIFKINLKIFNMEVFFFSFSWPLRQFWISTEHCKGFSWEEFFLLLLTRQINSDFQDQWLQWCVHSSEVTITSQNGGKIIICNFFIFSLAFFSWSSSFFSFVSFIFYHVIVFFLAANNFLCNIYIFSILSIILYCYQYLYRLIRASEEWKRISCNLIFCPKHLTLKIYPRLNERVFFMQKI